MLTNGACCHSLAQAADHTAEHQHILHIGSTTCLQPLCKGLIKALVAAASIALGVTYLAYLSGKMANSRKTRIHDMIHDMFQLMSDNKQVSELSDERDAKADGAIAVNACFPSCIGRPSLAALA